MSWYDDIDCSFNRICGSRRRDLSEGSTMVEAAKDFEPSGASLPSILPEVEEVGHVLW